LKNVLTQFKRTHYLKPILDKIESLKKQTVTSVNEAIGVELLQQTIQHNDSVFLNELQIHTSDAVRCWITYTIGRNKALQLKQMLINIKPFAADTHFGVREIAWIAVRPTIANNLKESVLLLSKWTSDKDENIRRFASEITRPRGVWCEHIAELKQHPEIALPILTPLNSDNHKYVQDSVGNWLNDASKTQPKFVTDLCKKWLKESKTKQTEYIVKKALRTIEK
jgi:3-methyladenine DNA glycosylase AlkC